MLVKEVMIKEVKTARPDTTVKEAAEVMNSHRIGPLVVVSPAGKIVGIMTERNVIELVATGRNSEETKVEEIMTKEVITIGPDATLEEAASLMTDKKVRKLPVIDNGRLVGIITASDLVAHERELIEKVATLLTHSPFKGIGG